METQTSLIGLLFIVSGVVLIKFRTLIGRRAATLYKKMGIEVPDEQYIKQFVFIGILLMIIGFLGASGLLMQF